MQKQSKLLTDDLSRIIIKIATPVSIGFLFQNLFNLTDQFYAGRLSTDALAALSVNFPVFFFIIAIASGLSNSITALVANNLGAKNPQAARKIIAQGLSLGLLAAIITLGFGYYNVEVFLIFLGAKSHVFKLALEYSQIIILATPFFIFTGILNSGNIANGNTKVFRNNLMIGFIINLILDPILMYGLFGFPKLGVAGLALSTVFVQVFACFFIARALFKNSFMKEFKLKLFLPDLKIWLNILQLSLPATFSMFTVWIGLLIQTHYAGGFGELALAANGIGMRVEQLVLLPLIGLHVAALSVAGQNFGAGLIDQVKLTYQTCIFYAFKISIILAPCLILFRKQIISFFSTDLQVLAYSELYVLVAALTGLAYSIIWISVSTLQAMQKPIFAMILGLLRQLFLPLLLFPILTARFNYNGICYALFGITWFAALISVLYLRYVFIKTAKPCNTFNL